MRALMSTFMRAFIPAFKRASIYLAFSFLWAALSACTDQPQTPAVSLQIPEIKLAPASLGASMSLAQRLTLVTTSNASINARPLAQRTLETILEIDPTTVRLAAFAMGQRVLSLSWDGTTLNETRHFLLPVEVNSHKVLRDITINYWPAEAIRSRLPAGWTLLDTDNERIMSYQDQPQIIIHYSASPRWSGRADLDNRLENYKLSIESTLQPEPAP